MCKVAGPVLTSMLTYVCLLAVCWCCLQDAHLRFTMTRENGVTYSMAVPILRPDPAEEAAEGEEDAGVPGPSAMTLFQTPQHNTARNRNTWQYRRMLDADSFWRQRLLTASCVSKVWPTAVLLYNT